jgi:DNA-directed RNA polymerase specialized sigma24 family protein
MALMDETPALKKDWIVTQGAFDLLLRQLDSDRERAGQRYELIRRKLMKFFEWRGCTTPDEYADRTIDRVARRIAEGEEIRAGDPYLFFHGVALNVLREHWKGVQKAEIQPLDDLSPAKAATLGERESQQQRDRADREVRLGCLDGCVKDLPPQNLVLITEYHRDQGAAKIARRNQLAKELNIPLNALRIRAYRIRGELENCVSDCTRRKAG